MGATAQEKIRSARKLTRKRRRRDDKAAAVRTEKSGVFLSVLHRNFARKMSGDRSAGKRAAPCHVVKEEVGPPDRAVADHVYYESRGCRYSLVQVIAEGRWLKLEKTTYVDGGGTTRIWETAKRTTRKRDSSADGVGIIAILKRTLHIDCVVLVKQFRPPMGRHTLELPAGLLDENESMEAAALRELKEETGYIGEVVGITPVSCLDPGLSNCTTHVVMVNINGDDPENLNPTQQLGEEEFVEVVLLPLNEFQKKIDELLQKEDIIVDCKVYMYAMGLTQAVAKPSELPVLKQ